VNYIVKKISVGFLIFMILSTGLLINNSYAIISPNHSFTLEGSGFAVTEKLIKTSEINLILTTQQQNGSTIKSSIEGGFITLDDTQFDVTKLSAEILRGGNYIRINGIVENEAGEQALLKFFGRLVEESSDASIYGFRGRIIINDQEYKIIYVTKLSNLSTINVNSSNSNIPKSLEIHILKNSSTKGPESYIGISADSAKYFSQNRISTEPGTTIIFINDDVVSHNLSSGRENFQDRYHPFTEDGKISTGEIMPGKTINVKFDQSGFYRLFDPNYQWMNIVVYVFPNQDNVILGQSKNSGN
jgi:plastocyanin